MLTEVAVITANLGKIDKPVEHVKQVIPGNYDVSWHLYTDENFPPRKCAMSPRLQAKIPKWFGWQLAPGADIYVWIDASFQMSSPDSLEWLIKHLYNKEITMFRHPDRTTIRDEAQFLRDKLRKGGRYVSSRYANEFLEEQLAACFSDPTYVDNKLYAGGIFAYINTFRVQNYFKDVWHHNTRYHMDEQLAIPYLLHHHNLSVGVIDEDIYHAEKFAFVRGR